jgi:hypothetical protein
MDWHAKRSIALGEIANDIARRGLDAGFENELARRMTAN